MNAPVPHTFGFLTLGCRLNQAEEAQFAGQFESIGWRRAAPEETPDAIVLHSCAVTRNAERETFQRLRSLRRARGDSPTPVLVVTGCAVACNSAEAFLEAGADLLVPRKEHPRLAELVAERLGQEEPPLAEVPRPVFSTSRALLKVQDGCSFGCAYCIVPHTRGPATSRPWAEVLSEAEAILAQGFLEIVVTGCNLACYRDGPRGLADLADAVCRLAEPCGARIRLGSVEPGICDDALRDLLLARGNICRFLHYPIQSGDTAVLQSMGRHYTAEYIADLLRRLRGEMPLIGLGADFITGLPGEDEAAFARTCDLVRAVPFAHIHVFPFSPRQGTRAAQMAGAPPRAVAKARAARLRAFGEESALAYRREWLGHETGVLVETRERDGRVAGWNEGYVLCRFPSSAPVATLASFTPARIAGNALE